MSIDKKIVNQLLDRLKDYLHDLEGMEFTLEEIESSRDIQHLVNHRLHTAVEICIDIAMNIASALELPDRDSAVDVIRLLGTNKIISKKLAGEFQQAPKLRNLLIHGYAKVDYGLIYKDISKDVSEMKDFAGQIKDFIDKN